MEHGRGDQEPTSRGQDDLCLRCGGGLPSLPDARRRLQDDPAGGGQGRPAEAPCEDQGGRARRAVPRCSGRDERHLRGALPLVLHVQQAQREAAHLRPQDGATQVPHAQRAHRLLQQCDIGHVLQLDPGHQDHQADLDGADLVHVRRDHHHRQGRHLRAALPRARHQDHLQRLPGHPVLRAVAPRPGLHEREEEVVSRTARGPRMVRGRGDWWCPCGVSSWECVPRVLSSCLGGEDRGRGEVSTSRAWPMVGCELGLGPPT
mmetsp:Transcript_36668/g.92968  ORF Transcript_36668/g.92968 Transcript_36668/m.92968 type:complete len:261 (+) Transcript_36668:413-1195(+)